jgi:hypothetical protein
MPHNEVDPLFLQTEPFLEEEDGEEGELVDDTASLDQAMPPMHNMNVRSQFSMFDREQLDRRRRSRSN